MYNIYEILVLSTYVIGSMCFAYYLNVNNKKRHKKAEEKINEINTQFDISVLELEIASCHKQYWILRNCGDNENAERILKYMVSLDERVHYLKEHKS